MISDLPRCPDCGFEATPVGPIPPTDQFAGRSLEHPLLGGSLYRCGHCSLGFRWPRLCKNDLDTLYAQGDETAWAAPAHSRPDWRIAHGWLAKTIPVGSRILDLGCFDGRFLQPLVESYRCAGIEIHSAARKRAEQNGIEVIGSNFSSINGAFDCITAFDVIEHVEQPRSFINDCLSALRPGGWVLVSTGNLDAFSFRLMGSRYWYSTIAEHISFVSPEWFSRLGGFLDCRVDIQASFSHVDASWPRYIGEFAKNLLYRYGGLAFRKLRILGMGGKNVKTHPELANHPPFWGSARDHFIVVVQKR